MNGTAKRPREPLVSPEVLDDFCNRIRKLEVIETLRRQLLWCVATIGVYAFWVLNYSIAPILVLVLFVALHNEWKKEKEKSRIASKNVSMSDEKTIIQSSIKTENIPPWVLFPDKERAEWINTIVEKLWPNVGHYVRNVIKEYVEPDVQSALQQYGIRDFYFEKVALGHIPPRITGVKVYDKTSTRNHILLDIDLMYSSDCDITFSIKSLNSGIKDLSLHGTLRVELKPLITEMPLFGSAKMYFVSSPEVNFNFSGIANVLDITGLGNILRTILVEVLGTYMVFPNKLSVWPPNDEKSTDFQAGKSCDGGIHFGITCNNCKTSPISGMRYKCSECPNLNLCGVCMSKGIHDNHIMQNLQSRRVSPLITHPGKNITRISYTRK